jgi:hypothetical protein
MKFNQFTDLEKPSDLLADFGLQPVSNRFLRANSTEQAPSFPLQLRINQRSGLIFLAKPFPIEEMKPRYDWLTCYEPEDHLDNLVQLLTTLPGIASTTVFGAYSFKDDSTLRRLEQKGFNNTWRIDPVQDLRVTDPCANVETYQRELTLDVAQSICDRYGAADVFIVRHVLEHAYDLPAFIAAIRAMVRPGGYVVWELPDCERSLDTGDCTTIWEEHVFYFTAHTFKQLLLSFGFSIEHYESVPYRLENSLVAIVKNTSVHMVETPEDRQATEKEIIRATSFVRTLNRQKIEVRKKLTALKKEKGPIAMFGAGHLSVAFISLMQVADLISFVIDDNPNKKGLQMPVGGLQIVGSEVLYSADICVCLLGLNPQNQPKVMSNHCRFTEQGGIFVSIFSDNELGLEHLQ